jgi:hypothetical protein
VYWRLDPLPADRAAIAPQNDRAGIDGVVAVRFGHRNSEPPDNGATRANLITAIFTMSVRELVRRARSAGSRAVAPSAMHERSSAVRALHRAGTVRPDGSLWFVVIEWLAESIRATSEVAVLAR